MAFKPRARVSVLAASAVAVSAPADTNENILATITIPAGAMGLNGILRVYSIFTLTNNANQKDLRGRLGGIGGTDFFQVNGASTATWAPFRVIYNRGAANSQVGYANNGSGVGGITNSVITGAIDTSIAQTFVITTQKASAGDTVTLQSYLAELILP